MLFPAEGYSIEVSSTFLSLFQLVQATQEQQQERGRKKQKTWRSEIVSAPTYYPTWEEFQDPMQYIASIGPEASKYGEPRASLNSYLALQTKLPLTNYRVTPPMDF